MSERTGPRQTVPHVGIQPLQCWGRSFTSTASLSKQTPNPPPEKTLTMIADPAATGSAETPGKGNYNHVWMEMHNGYLVYLRYPGGGRGDAEDAALRMRCEKRLKTRFSIFSHFLKAEVSVTVRERWTSLQHQVTLFLMHSLS